MCPLCTSKDTSYAPALFCFEHTLAASGRRGNLSQFHPSLMNGGLLSLSKSSSAGRHPSSVPPFHLPRHAFVGVYVSHALLRLTLQSPSHTNAETRQTMHSWHVHVAAKWKWVNRPRHSVPRLAQAQHFLYAPSIIYLVLQSTPSILLSNC